MKRTLKKTTAFALTLFSVQIGSLSPRANADEKLVLTIEKIKPLFQGVTKGPRFRKTWYGKREYDERDTSRATLKLRDPKYPTSPGYEAEVQCIKGGFEGGYHLNTGNLLFPNTYSPEEILPEIKDIIFTLADSRGNYVNQSFQFKSFDTCKDFVKTLFQEDKLHNFGRKSEKETLIELDLQNWKVAISERVKSISSTTPPQAQTSNVEKSLTEPVSNHAPNQQSSVGTTKK